MQPPDGDNRPTWEDWVGGIILAVLALITFGNVLMRYFSNQSFAWTEEFSVTLMLVLTLAAAGAAVVRDRHIRIEVLFAKAPPAICRRYDLLAMACTVLAFALLAGLGGRLAWDDYIYEVTSPGIGVPQWWYTICLPLFALTICWRAIQRGLRLWRTRG